MQKHFHNLMLGVSVLPALLVMPAMAAYTPQDSYTAQDEKITVTSGGQTFDGVSFTGFSTSGTDCGAAMTIEYSGTDDKGLTTISNSLYSGNSAVADSEADSGGFNVSRGNVLVENTKFLDNEAKTGGAIYIYLPKPADYFSKLVIKDSVFEGNMASGEDNDDVENGGGAIVNVARNYRNNGDAGLWISDSQFIGNKNTKNNLNGGGAINAGSESRTNIVNTEFIGNTSASRGGAISGRNFDKGENSKAVMDIIGSTFKGNIAATTGGAIDNTFYDSDTRDGSVYVAGTTFGGTGTGEGNIAANGGAIYNHISQPGDHNQNQTGNMYVINSSFLGNSATSDGGAIYNEGVLTFTDTIFGGTAEGAGNSAKNGGAIYNKARVTITDSTFAGNSVLVPVAEDSTYKKEGVGGAIASAGSLTISGSTFTNNTARTTGSGWGLGGALSTLTVYGDTAEMTVTGSTFTGNSADTGGAVYGMLKASSQRGLSNITISSSAFNGNRARTGSAIANFDRMSVTNATFTGNETFGNDDGGTVFLGSDSITSFTGGSFSNNTTDTVGGAIATRKITQGTNTNATLDITGTTFKGNSAATTGGAIDNNFYNSVGHAGSVYVSGVTFGGAGENEGNSAVNGGAIYNHANGSQTGSMYLTGTNFIGNTATINGGAIYNEGVLTLAGTNTFIGNTANGVANDIHNLSELIIEGTTTIDGGITGDTGGLIIADGAILNLGAASVTQKDIILDGGTITATLDKNATSALFNATTYAGTGTLELAMAETGTYHVFGGDSFDIETDMPWTIGNAGSAVAFTNSKVYNLSWTKGDITAEKKSVEEIASGNDIAVESAAVVSNVIDSASASHSKQMKELSVKLQEKLAEGDTAAIEHATKAVHPETESVARSVSTSVQNTVVNLASARMAAPSVGRNGGDVKLTSGGVWAQGLFNKSKQADAFNGYTRGIAVGLDGTINKHWTVGAGYSFAHSDITGTARDTEIDSNTVFLYGQYKPSAWYVNAIANYTMSDYSEKGTVIDNTPVFGDYDVNSFGGALATGYDFRNGVTPELGLRYMHVNANDYANSYGIKTHMDDSDFLTGVVGAKYAFDIVATRHTVFMPQLNAGLKYDLLSDKQVATVTMPGLKAYTLDGSRLNRVGGEFGIGLGMRYDNLEVSVNYDIDIRKDYTSQTGMLKFRCNF